MTRQTGALFADSFAAASVLGRACISLSRNPLSAKGVRIVKLTSVGASFPATSITKGG